MMPARTRSRLRAAIVFAACTYGAGGAAVAAEYGGVCPNGAPVRYEKYCKAVVKYKQSGDTEQVDSRIADALAVKYASETRSIALIIAIGKYEHHDGLSAASVDGDKLETFLGGKQGFDEVISLRDGAATADAISYFVRDYLAVRPEEFKRKARLLIAYSGHGRPTQGPERAAFLLSGVQDVHGSEDVYLMEDFSRDVQSLSDSYFHVLTLINACYGGEFFGIGAQGGAPDMIFQPGSFALTAGPSEKEVPALDAARGSLFFDLIIDGVDRGVADPDYWSFLAPLVDEGGHSLRTNRLLKKDARAG